MGFHRGPKIVTDGLVLALDAANTKSYPGTGTTWTDLSGGNTNGTLVNGPTFSSANGGSIVFDGVDDYVDTPSFNKDSNSALSVFCWVYSTSFTTSQFGGVYFNWIINKRNTTSPNANSWQMLARESYLTISIWDSSSNGITPALVDQSTIPLQLNKWQLVGFSTNGINGGFLKNYIDGVEVFSGTLTGTRGIESKPLRIGATGWGGGLTWSGNISTAQIYNRALTAQEIQQNYNVTKSRFGL